jgi:hypothetical protein
MTARHADFEFLCALATNGDLDSAGYTRLKEHIEHCASCRECFRDMHRLEAQLVLAQALSRPNERLPRGMRERFLTRAARAGIPVSSCSSRGIGFPALGMVTALLIVLLLAAANLKTGPFKRFAAATDVAGTSSFVSAPVLKANLRETSDNQSLDTQARTRKAMALRRRVRLHSTMPAVNRFAVEGRQFHFSLFAQDSPTARYPLWTEVTVAQTVPSLNYPNHTPRLSLDASSEVFRHLAPSLLAYGPTGASGLRSNLDLGPPTGRSFRLIKVDSISNGYRWPQTPGDSSQ